MILFNNILNKFVMVTDFIRIKVVKKTGLLLQFLPIFGTGDLMN